MSGASAETERVTFVNANWGPGSPSRFELLVVTESGRRHTVPVAPEEMAAVVALTQASSVLLRDTEGGTQIAANLVGEWIPLSWSAADAREAR